MIVTLSCRGVKQSQKDSQPPVWSVLPAQSRAYQDRYDDYHTNVINMKPDLTNIPCLINSFIVRVSNQCHMRSWVSLDFPNSTLSVLTAAIVLARNGPERLRPSSPRRAASKRRRHQSQDDKHGSGSAGSGGLSGRRVALDPSGENSRPGRCCDWCDVYPGGSGGRSWKTEPAD